MSYFAGLGDYNNTTGVQPTSSAVIDGNSATVQNGDLYDEQNGNTTLVGHGDLKSVRKGYSNSLVDGFTFSTTLGGTFPTIAGANVATTGGGVMATVAPYALKSVAGWDCDIKLGVQNTVNRGSSWEQCGVTYRATPVGNFKYRPEAELFELQAQEWGGEKSDLVEGLRQTAVEKIQRFGERLENVFGAHSLRVVGHHRVRALGLDIRAPSTSLFMFENITMRSGMTVFASELIELG